MKRTLLSSAIIAAITASGAMQAQAQGVLEEVIVTAS
jgi:hypothetical protein